MAVSRRVSFGVFDFDPSTGELRREGILVRLQAQPAQVLAFLIVHAGEIVTRESLRDAVWGSDTFVDFDRSINFCIAQIRTVLGDSAESPRFIRTVPKRGYQFIAPVSLPPEPADSAVVERGSPKRVRAMAAIAGILLTAGIGYWLLRPKPAGLPVTVAVVRFDNETGDPGFGSVADALTDSVIGELTLGGSGQFSVIGNASILRAPRQGRDLLAIGSALRAGYVVLGQVQRSSGGIRILAHLIRLPDQKHVWVVRADSPPERAAQIQSELAQRIASEFCRHLNAERSSAAAGAALHPVTDR